MKPGRGRFEHSRDHPDGSPGGSRFESDRSPHCEGTGCSGVSYALHAGSIPALATRCTTVGPVAQFGSAAPLQGEGCGFESRAVHRETSRADVAQRKRHGAQNAVSAGSNPAVSTNHATTPGRGATAAHRLREPGVGSSNLSVQTQCEVVEVEPRLTLNQEDRVRALASQPDDASAVVAHLDRRSRPVAKAGVPS